MRAPRFSRVAFATILCVVLLSAPAAATSLYDDLGGNPGLTAIISDMIDAAVADPLTANKLDNINIPRLKQRIVEQVCELTGGPCVYHGISMKGSHAYLQLQDRHFNAMVVDLQNAMDKANIPFHTQNRLLALLAPMRRDIVTK
jgi:hemoglobin